MRKAKKTEKSPLWVRKLVRLHFILTLLFFSVYFLVVTFDPGFLSYDLRQKFHALADDTILVTATVLPPPAKPVVSATSVCDGDGGNVTVVLNWGDDTGATSFDIDRDGSTLVTGLTDSNYTDTNVALGTGYSYEVTANGPMGPGIEVSDPVSVTTDADCTVSTQPTIQIVTFNDKNLHSFSGRPKTSNRRPYFSGVTNIPNAIIDVIIHSDPYYYFQKTANENGYWRLRGPSNLSPGSHLFTITATDPLDSSRHVSASFTFQIAASSSDSGNSGSSGSSTENVGGAVAGSGISSEKASPINFDLSIQASPLDFDLSIKNDHQAVEQGNAVSARLHISQLDPAYENVSQPIRFSIFDEKGVNVFTIIRSERLAQGKDIVEYFDAPLYWHPGKYTLRAEVLLDEATVGREASFTLLELPLLQLGSGSVLTYSQVVQNIGWILFLLFFLLLLWFFFSLREYSLYIRAKNHVTEYMLKRAGYFDK